jgi:type II secretory pathway component PulK
MKRNGFALLAVLWVITAMTALTGAGVLVARLGSETTRNRVLLARAEWAREACGEILQARWAATRSVRKLEPIDLGRGTWCRASLDDPAAKLNLNTADRDELALLLAGLRAPTALADSVIALRRQGAIYDVRQVPGCDSVLAARLAAFVTTRGIGVINVNAAAAEVLRGLPGITEEAVVLLLSRRASRPLQSADELAGALSRSSRSILLTSYAEFVRGAVFAPPQLIASVEGGVGGTPIVARATLTLVPVPDRLAVIRRETE